MSKSKNFTVVKYHNGRPYKELEGQEIEFLYKVRVCKGGDCTKCKKFDDSHPLREGKLKVRLGDGILHEFIEDTLLKGNIRQGSAVTFFLTSDEAYGEIGVKLAGSDADMVIKPNESICCYIIEPV